MKSIVKGLFLFCILLTTTNQSFSEEDEALQIHKSQSKVNDHGNAEKTLEKLPQHEDNVESRSIADSAENSANFEKHSKPLRSIFLGIYKNYKSTYLGNKTLTEYKQSLRENIKNQQQQQQQHQDINEQENKTDSENDNNDDDDDGLVIEYSTIATEAATAEPTIITTLPPGKQQSKTNRKRKNPTNTIKNDNKVQLYKVGPALNMSLDMANSIVKVNLDAESLRELVTGRWLSDNTEEGKL